MQPDFSLPSFAKINWTLRILDKRADGFYELFTVFQTISLSDTIHFTASGALELSCDDRNIPTDDSNLIVRAALRLQRRFSIKNGAAIHLEKRIPSPGGLGGGSSNAATALIGLSRLWEIDAADEVLRDIAADLGSDVPFFLTGGTAIGTGRGELIEPVDEREEQFLLIVTPDVNVPTRDAFSRISSFRLKGVHTVDQESRNADLCLTNDDTNRILRVCRLEAESSDLWQSALINDFESAVFEAYPAIKRVKDTLLGLGAKNAAMSGSGASVFAIFDKTETRQAALKALDHESTWRKFAVSTVSRRKYREALRCQVVSD